MYVVYVNGARTSTYKQKNSRTFTRISNELTALYGIKNLNSQVHRVVIIPTQFLVSFDTRESEE